MNSRRPNKAKYYRKAGKMRKEVKNSALSLFQRDFE